MRLDDDDRLDDDVVRSPSRRVTVELEDGTVFLDVEGKPKLRRRQLLEGLEVELAGQMIRETGTFVARQVLVVPGELDDARAFNGVPSDSSFNATGDIEEPFGDSVQGGVLRVVLADKVLFEDGVSSRREFFGLLERLNENQSLEVHIEGIGSGRADEIIAYEIEVDDDRNDDDDDDSDRGDDD